MTVELRNVPGQPEPQGFSHVSIARGDRIVHVAGRVGTDEAGRVVEGGLGAQARQAMANVGLALDAAGATESDVVKLTVYVVDWEPAKFPELGGGLMAARSERPWRDVPTTVIGVQALFEPEMLIEVEAVAVC